MSPSSMVESASPNLLSETAPLRNNTLGFADGERTTSYGTLSNTPTFGRRARGPPGRLSLAGSRVVSRQPSISPTSLRTPPLRSLRDVPSVYFNRERPISAYDAPLFRDLQSAASDAADRNGTPGEAGKDRDPGLAASVNGLRVWYASFTSIDWLHDGIKDAIRRGRLRRHRKSVRGRTRVLMDRAMGWIIVTIVGFLTAIAAFLIVRSEQLLFDFKEGYCSAGWWKAHRFCCNALPDDIQISGPGVSAFRASRVDEDQCDAWRTWSEVFGPVAEKPGQWMGLHTGLTEYVAYACIALTLAWLSCLLTINLTASNTFTTRKDSSVIASDYSAPETPEMQNAKRRVMYYAAGSGIPEIKTILAGFVIHGYLGGRTLFTKSVGLALSVASGLSLGKEGPFVHIASCIGNIISRFFAKYENNEGKRREILSAASAAGVAVAFGAPIGGVLFSLEEVSYFFPPKVMWRSFFCAMIAAITLRLLDPFGTGKLVLFQVTYDKEWHAYELLPFLVLGVFGGVYGAYFSKLNIRWSKHVRNKTWMKAHPVWEVLMITLLTTLLCFLNPYTRMGGTELVYNLFAECRPGQSDHEGLCIVDPTTQAGPVIAAIGTALLVKGALTVVTFGIKLPAGIFIPTLGVGACAGRILGILVQWAFYKYPDSLVFSQCKGDLNCVIPGLYAMVGAAATLSGVTRTTVSLAVIMFELTDTLTYVVPLMLSVLVAKTVADALEPKGIYDLVIEMNKLPFLDAKHDYLWGDLEISDIVDRDVPTIQLEKENTVRDVHNALLVLARAGYDDGVLPVLRRNDHESDYRLVGAIGASEIEHALSIVADEPDEPVHFHTVQTHPTLESSVASLFDGASQNGLDPFDFSIYMDQAPLTVQRIAPLELVHQFFTKLGAKYVVVTDTDGFYDGIIDKKSWLAFTSDLEHKSH